VLYVHRDIDEERGHHNTMSTVTRRSLFLSATTLAFLVTLATWTSLAGVAWLILFMVFLWLTCLTWKDWKE